MDVSASWRTRLVSSFLVIYSAFVLQELHAQTATAPAKSQEKIQWAGYALSEVRTLRELPADIQAVLGVGTPGVDGIADRNGEYNATDVVDSRLPNRRLLFAGLDGDTTLVAVEHGGRGWRVEVALFKKSAPEGKWTLFKSPTTLRELMDQLPLRLRVWLL
jgi:hypothetical protein